ncbi:MAG: CAP domain-containing protein [Actinomycetota bacterium]
MGRCAVVLTLVLGLALPALPARAADPETRLRRMINEERVRRDLVPLKGARKADRLAESHSRKMARAGTVSSSRNVERALRRRGYRFSSWGENVGCRQTLRAMHRSFMHRQASRRNILLRRFRRVGIGVVVTERDPRVCNGATVWVTQIFFG